MKKIIMATLLAISVSYAYSQTQQQNLEKYWRYRDRLRERFIVVSQNVEEEGVNIPCGYLFTDKAKFSDGNYNMSHYLSLLSTELYMLKKNGQDYSETLKELYYAMLAMERLDLYSEAHWNKYKGKITINAKDKSPELDENLAALNNNTPISESEYKPTDINNFNGMHLRDDITNAFWKKYKSKFGDKPLISCYASGTLPLEEISQDVMYHNIEGLSLVAKLVGTENVSNVPAPIFMAKGGDGKYLIPKYLENKGIKESGNNINFSLWAKDFIKRYIIWFQSSDKGEPLVSDKILNYWVLRNSVTKQPVQEGSGIDGGPDAYAFYSEGLISVGENIVGENLRSKPTLVDGLFGELFVNHLSGIEDIAALTTGATSFLASPIVDFGASLFGIPPGTVTGMVTVTSPIWSKQIAKKVFSDIVYDDYKVRSLACTGNYSGKNTFLYLQRNCNTYSPQGAPFPIYEHLGLMNLVLYDLDLNGCNWMSYNGSPLKREVSNRIIQLESENSDLYRKIAEAQISNDQNAISTYNLKINKNMSARAYYIDYLRLLNYENYSSNKSMYETLLNLAPDCGPTSKGSYVKDWSTASRLIWPEYLGQEPAGDFCGMDYMLLYNLYCIAFSREQYVTTTSTSSTIRAIEASKTITSNVTHSAPCITLKPGFEAKASNSCSYTARAVALPTDFVDGTKYCRVNYSDCGCSTTMATAAKEKTRVYMAKPKIENDSVLVEDGPIESFAEDGPVESFTEESLEINAFGKLCNNGQSILVTPNPATNIMDVCVRDGFTMPTRVEVISLTGVLVDAVELSEQPYCQFDVSQWMEGIYVVRAISESKVVSVNVMVKH